MSYFYEENASHQMAAIKCHRKHALFEFIEIYLKNIRFMSLYTLNHTHTHILVQSVQTDNHLRGLLFFWLFDALFDFVSDLFSLVDGCWNSMSACEIPIWFRSIDAWLNHIHRFVLSSSFEHIFHFHFQFTDKIFHS